MGTQGIFHYIAFKLRERWGIINTKVTRTAIQAIQAIQRFSSGSPSQLCVQASAKGWGRLRADNRYPDLQDGLGTANTALTFHNKQLLALVENDLPYAVRSPHLAPISFAPVHAQCWAVRLGG